VHALLFAAVELAKSHVFRRVIHDLARYEMPQPTERAYSVRHVLRLLSATFKNVLVVYFLFAREATHRKSRAHQAPWWWQDALGIRGHFC
jgi:hypothetical protein